MLQDLLHSRPTCQVMPVAHHPWHLLPILRQIIIMDSLEVWTILSLLLMLKQRHRLKAMAMDMVRRSMIIKVRPSSPMADKATPLNKAIPPNSSRAMHLNSSTIGLPSLMVCHHRQLPLPKAMPLQQQTSPPLIHRIRLQFLHLSLMLKMCSHNSNIHRLHMVLLPWATKATLSPNLWLDTHNRVQRLLLHTDSSLLAMLKLLHPLLVMVSTRLPHNQAMAISLLLLLLRQMLRRMATLVKLTLHRRLMLQVKHTVLHHPLLECSRAMLRHSRCRLSLVMTSQQLLSQVLTLLLLLVHQFLMVRPCLPSPATPLSMMHHRYSRCTLLLVD